MLAYSVDHFPISIVTYLDQLPDIVYFIFTITVVLPLKEILTQMFMQRVAPPKSETAADVTN